MYNIYLYVSLNNKQRRHLIYSCTSVTYVAVVGEYIQHTQRLKMGDGTFLVFDSQRDEVQSCHILPLVRPSYILPNKQNLPDWWTAFVHNPCNEQHDAFLAHE